MTFNISTARLAGFLYLALVLTGIYNLIYVPSRTIVTSEAQPTLALLLDNQTLFASGLATGLISYLVFLALAIVLWRALAPKGETLAAIMVALVAVSIPISFMAIGESLAILPMLDEARAASDFDRPAIAEDVYAALRANSATMKLATIFWGLWLFPFGLLAWRARLVPRVLAVLLMLGCFGYLAKFFGPLLIADFSDMVFVAYIGLPASIGEIGTCLWLALAGEWWMKRGQTPDSAS